jgi:hypothetical protein
MWYNNGPRYRHSYRHGGFRGLYGIPWIIFGLIWFVHTYWLLIPVAILIAVLFIAAQARRSNTQFGGQGQRYSNNYYTPPIYQPPFEQPPQRQSAAESYYEPYQRGYQEEPVQQESEQDASRGEQRSSEQEYDLPKAEYPQQMPPME